MKETGKIQKAHNKLLKLAAQAELCIDREEARKLIKKADKAHAKLNS